MIEDPVVQEVRRLRQEHAARFDYDLAAIFADLKKSEEARDRQDFPLQPPQDLQEVPTNGEPARVQPRLARFGR
ncbi:MAG TPA: hypothetical protein VH394_05840 [Thermoanaerobaculia bacterium]|jgi:hypothetical protein|nr:hypothetical protein [Thermoanaerobaculia bacterium]